jgi:hypothetical protein
MFKPYNLFIDFKLSPPLQRTPALPHPELRANRGDSRKKARTVFRKSHRACQNNCLKSVVGEASRLTLPDYAIKPRSKARRLTYGGGLQRIAARVKTDGCRHEHANTSTPLPPNSSVSSVPPVSSVRCLPPSTTIGGKARQRLYSPPNGKQKFKASCKSRTENPQAIRPEAC